MMRYSEPEAETLRDDPKILHCDCSPRLTGSDVPTVVIEVRGLDKYIAIGFQSNAKACSLTIIGQLTGCRIIRFLCLMAID